MKVKRPGNLNTVGAYKPDIVDFERECNTCTYKYYLDKMKVNLKKIIHLNCYNFVEQVYNYYCNVLTVTV